MPGGHNSGRSQGSDYNLDVRLGNVPGVSKKTWFFHSDTMDTNLRLIHHEMQTLDLSTVALFDTPSTVKVASTDNTADIADGTGALTVLLTGYESGEGTTTTEAITLTGQTEVTSANTYQYIESLTVTSAGSGGSNAGRIWCGNGTFTSGVPTTAYMSIEIGTNLSRGMHPYVPTGMTAYFESLWANVNDTSKEVNVQVNAYNLGGLGLEYEIFDTHHKAADDWGIPTEIFGPGFPGPMMMLVRGKVATGSEKITVVISGKLCTN